MRLLAYAMFGVGLTVLVAAGGCGGQAIGGPGGAGGSGGSGGTGGSGGSGGSGGTGGSGGSLGSGGAGGSGGSGGISIDAGPPGCPSSPPAGGSSCDNPNLWCEYGTSTNPYCNSLFQCSVPAGTWTDMSTGGICAMTTCPTSYAAAEGAGSCTAQGTICEYPQGPCICTSDPGGLPSTGGPIWSCTPLTKGCPATRPALGTPCPASGPSPVCDYGGCSGGVNEQCIDGFWGIAMTACPA